MRDFCVLVRLGFFPLRKQTKTKIINNSFLLLNLSVSLQGISVQSKTLEIRWKGHWETAESSRCLKTLSLMDFFPSSKVGETLLLETQTQWETLTITTSTSSTYFYMSEQGLKVLLFANICANVCYINISMLARISAKQTPFGISLQVMATVRMRGHHQQSFLKTARRLNREWCSE